MNHPKIPQVAYAGVICNDLRGRSVIITGGASGIGADIATPRAWSRPSSSWWMKEMHALA